MAHSVKFASTLEMGQGRRDFSIVRGLVTAVAVFLLCVVMVPTLALADDVDASAVAEVTEEADAEAAADSADVGSDGITTTDAEESDDETLVVNGPDAPVYEDPEGSLGGKGTPLHATKTLIGGTLQYNDFQFEVVDEGGNVVSTGTNDAQGVIHFSAILYSGEDAGVTYTYTVREVTDGLAERGITCGASSFAISVYVEDMGFGVLEPRVTYPEGTDSLEFVNTQWTPTSLSIGATKVLEGEDLAAGRFAFELVDASGSVVSTATNDATGAVAFDDIEYTLPGEWTYTIREVNDEQEDVTYDSSVYTVVVTVTDAGDGKLAASYVVTDAQGAASSATFTNSVEPKVPARPTTPTTPTRTVVRTSKKAALPATGDASVLASAMGLVAAGAGCVGVALRGRSRRK